MRNPGGGSWSYPADLLNRIAELMGEGPFGALLRVLDQSRRLGFLGPGPVEAHIELALAMAPLLPPGATPVMDLGSGGGVPGLPLAMVRPDIQWVLLDGSAKRCEFLQHAVQELDLTERTCVVLGRAEEAGHDPAWRGVFAALVSRSFAAPAVTAECGAPFLLPDGLLIVAEPVDGPDRWPQGGLDQLGLVREERHREPTALQVLRQSRPCPSRFPRRVGIPAKRPLF